MTMLTAYVPEYDDDDINRNIQNNKSFKSAILFLMILAILNTDLLIMKTKPDIKNLIYLVQFDASRILSVLHRTEVGGIVCLLAAA